MGTRRGCVGSQGRRSLPGRVPGGKCASASTPAAKMATSRALGCGARGLRTQEAGAKCIAGQNPRGCEAVVMGMPSLGGQGLVGGCWPVQTGPGRRPSLWAPPEAAPSSRTGCWGPAGGGEPCTPGGRVLSEAPEPPLVAEGMFLPWTTRGPSCCWHLQQGGRWSES